jgi:hypothetical protein
MADVLSSRVDVEQVRAWQRHGRAPGAAFLGAVVSTVLATWAAASWPGFWLPLLLPLKVAWLALAVVWLARLGVAIPSGAWRDFRWLGAPAAVLFGGVVLVAGLPLIARVALTSDALNREIRAQRAVSDSGHLRHQCAHGRCFDTYVPRGAGSPSDADGLGIYVNVRNSVTASALVWHPDGEPTYRPCGISGFEHVFGPWYVAKTAHVDCFA